MDLDRVKLIARDVVFEVWFGRNQYSKLRNGQHKGFLVFCYGCPSHPFDHNPAMTGALIEAGYILVYPHYLGTWESDGNCNFETCVDSIGYVITKLKEEHGRDIRTGKEVRWVYKRPVLIGSSFGGSVVLVVAAKSKDIKGIVALAPVTDFRTHNKLSFREENLDDTWKSIKTGWKHLWRVEEKDWKKLSNGQLDLNPIDYIHELKNKNVLLIHGKKDASVHYSRSVDLHNKIRTEDGKHDLLIIENGNHFGNFKVGEEPIRSYLIKWLAKIRD